MTKFKVEVEFSDDGFAMAGGNYGKTIQRAEIIDIECENRDQVENKIKSIFSDDEGRLYQTLRRIGTIYETS